MQRSENVVRSVSHRASELLTEPRRTPFRFMVALSWLLSACHRGGSSPPEASSQPEPATLTEAKSEFHEETFDLTLRPGGPLTAGAPGSIEIQLSAKAGYHCNDKYPYKFKVGESPGMKFRAPVFTTDALTLEEHHATMKLEVTPETAGEKTVHGVFAFSLCSAERCLVEKRELEAKVPVI
jgi:hypothetical protein